MNLINEKQKKRFEVIKLAEERLKHLKNYSGVCLENFPTDELILKDINSSVDKIVIETLTRMVS